MLYTRSGAPLDAFSKFPMPRNTEVFAPTFLGQGCRKATSLCEAILPSRSSLVPHADDQGKTESHLHAARLGDQRAAQEVGAIHECKEHGWAKDRADPQARQRAIEIAEQDPPSGFSPDEAVAEIRDVLDSIGETCPECPPPLTAMCG